MTCPSCNDASEFNYVGLSTVECVNGRCRNFSPAAYARAEAAAKKLADDIVFEAAGDPMTVGDLQQVETYLDKKYASPPMEGLTFWWRVGSAIDQKVVDKIQAHMDAIQQGPWTVPVFE